MKKRVIGKRKKLIALLSTIAVLVAGGIGTGVAFAAMAAVKKSASIRSQTVPGAFVKNNVRELLAFKEKKNEGSVLLSSSSSSSFGASALPGAPWSNGSFYESPAFMQAGDSSIPIPNFSVYSVSSGLYWTPFAFAGAPSPASSSGFDENEIKNWILGGNFASNDAVFLTDGYYDGGGGAPLFGGVNPQTGEPVTITTYNNSHYQQDINSNPDYKTFEQYAVTSCINNSSLPNGEGAAADLGVSSPSPSSCLAAFQKNAEAEVEINGASYNLLTYQGLSSLSSLLDYSIPSNWATGYEGPGISGPLQVTVGLSGALMYLLNSYSLPQVQKPYFGDMYFVYPLPSYTSASLTTYTPTCLVESKSPNSVPAGAPCAKDLELHPSTVYSFDQLPASFRAFGEDGEPLTKVKIALKVDSYPSNAAEGDGVGDYIWPEYWDPSDPDNPAVGETYNGPDSLDLSSSSPYKYFGWGPASSSAEASSFTLSSQAGEPGSFEIPNLVAGTYTVTLIGEGSEYNSPSFNITVSSSGSTTSETFSSSNDPDGFVDASGNTVIANAQNPSTQILGSQGETLEESDPDEAQGASHAFSYQLQSYLPFSSPFSIDLDPGTGYGIELSEGKVAGIPISTLEEHGASLSGSDLTLNSSAITYIEQNGFMPATASSPVGADKLSTSSGTQRVFSMEFPAYLTSSFKAGDEIGWSASYSNSAQGGKGQTLTGNFEGAGELSYAGSTSSSPSSSNPLWFRAISEDGKPLTQITIQYTEQLSNYNSGATGTLTLTSPSSSPGLFTLPSSLDSYMQDGNSLQISVEEGDYYSNSSSSGSSFVYLFNFSSLSGGNAQFSLNDYQEYDFSGEDSNPYTVYDGLINLSTRTVIVNASNPSSQVLSSNGKVDTSSNPTYTVGSSNLFTYQLQTLLAFPYENAPEVIQILNGTGEKVAQDPSDIEVAGIPLSTLENEGAAFYDSLPYVPYSGNGAGGNSTAALTLILPSKALSYIEQNGYLPATSSTPVGSSPLDGSRVLSVTFKAYLCPTQGKMQSPYYSIGVYETYKTQNGGIALYKVAASAKHKSPTSNLSSSDALLGGGPSMPLVPVYTNGPSDNSTPSSLAKATTASSLPLSSPSSSTGLWFINGLEDACGADATQFTVQNSSGQYLSPVEDGGTFEGWQFSSSPYDFKGSDFDKLPYYYLFTFGGLQDGTYTIKSVEHPDISFTSSLSYSSPQVLSGSGSFSFVESNPEPAISWRMEYAVKDGILEMTNLIGDSVSQLNPADAYGLLSSECHVPVIPPSPTPASPSHLPFTGGKGILGLSLASSFLFLLGAGVWWGLKKKRGSHASSSSSRHGL